MNVEGVFLKILNMSISAGWLVLAVVVLRFALQKAPKALRVVLWGIVGLRLVWPFSIESILSLIPSAETVPPDIGMAATPAIQSGVPVVNSLVNPVLGSSMAATPQYSINPMQVAQFIAAWVWVIGMGIMVLYALVSWAVVRLRVREAVREEKNIWVCDRIGSPFILGIFLPRIYLPSDMAEEDKPYVLAHERAHLNRRDHWWKPLGFALLAVHWFNPLVWLAYILLCRDIELACDERVIRQMGEGSKKPYSEALINCSVPRRMIAACPVAFGETGVKGRIKSVLNYKKPAFWIILVAIVVCIAVAVCFLTDPRQPEELNLTEPPAMEITAAGQKLTAKQGAYEWQGLCMDDFQLTELVDALPSLALDGAAEATVHFDLAPDALYVGCWPVGDTSYSLQTLTVTGTECFTLLDGDYVYEVLAEWNDRGKATYAFVVTTSPGGMEARPPQLLISDGNSAFKTWQGGYEWSYQQDGQTVHVIADADHPTAVVNKLPLLEAYPSTYSSEKGNTVSLTFSQKPDSISVVARALDPTSGAGGSVEATTKSFDLLEGEFIYVIDAEWEDHGRAQYAFVGSYNLPVITDVDDDLWRLQSTHPQFFNLDISNGLYVYVWKMASEGYYCGLGTKGDWEFGDGDYFGHAPEVFLRAQGLTFRQMHRILDTYDIDREDVHVVPFQNPISSYYWQIDDDTRESVENQFWEAK